MSAATARRLRTSALAVTAALALAATTVGCRSKPADEQTLRDAGITTTTAGATTSAPSTSTSTTGSEPDEDGPPTTAPRRTTSTTASTSTTADDTDTSLPAQLTGDVAAACAALRKVVDLDAQTRQARPTSLDDIQTQLRATWPPTREAYTEVIAAVGADTPFGREFQNLRDNTDTLTQAYLRAATLAEAEEVTTTYAEQVGEAAGSTFALNDPVKASCGFPLSAQLG